MTWSPVLRDGKIRAIRIAETGQQVVRWDGICDPVTDWGQNNARLILAAPEMLTALEQMCKNALEMKYCIAHDCLECDTMDAIKLAREEK